jgi:hypothetical protein
LDNQKASPAPVINSGGGNSQPSTFAPQITIQVNGNGATGDNSSQIAAAVQIELEKFWKTFGNANARVTEV